MRTLQVAIAGYGVVGKRRHECIRRHPQLQVVAVSDISFDGSGELMPGVPYCRDFRELVDHQADALMVCLPNDVAPLATIMGLERGMHVFCEKPPARNVADLLAVRDAEAANPGLILKYGFNHRYHESVKEAKALIVSGQFGRVLNLRGVYGKSRMIPVSGGWRSDRMVAGGGILLDQGIHMLDMIRHFAGDFDEVKSFVSNDYWKHDVEDNAWALLRNQSTGCVAMIHSTATQWRHKFRFEITLEGAFMELSGILSGSKSYGEEKLTIVERDAASVNGAFIERTTLYLEDPSWQDEVDEFADAVLNGGAVLSGTSAEALAVMQLVHEIYCADEMWKTRYQLHELQ